MDGQIVNPLMPLEYLLLLGGLLLAATARLAWRTAAHCRPGKRLVLAALRLGATAMLLLVAANPGRWERSDAETGREAVVILDRSASMATEDAGGTGSRWQQAQSVASAVRHAAGRESTVVVHAAAAELDPYSPEARPEGTATDLVGAGRTLLERYRGSGRQLEGILLVSDGRQTGGREARELAEHARAMDCPISVVPLGAAVAEPDLSVTMERRQYVALPGQRLTVSCTLHNDGLPGISPTLRLLDSAGVEHGRVAPQLADSGRHAVRLDVPDLAPGYHAFRMAVAPWPGEPRTANNTVAFAVLVPERKMRVFVAEGIPSWDTKFFLQLLRRQAFISVVSVSRVTSERYFDVRSDADAVRDSATAIFPDGLEELGQYDLVLVGRGAEYFLTEARLQGLREYVRDQGGCVLFFRGQPNQSPLPALEALEPVRWDMGVGGRSGQLRPTRAAETLGLFGDVLPGRDDDLWRSLPALRGVRQRAIPKDFAVVLMTAFAEDARAEDPVLVSRRFGKGQILTMDAEGLWQWDFFPVSERAQAIYATLWTQLLQWTVAAAEFLPGQHWGLRLSETSIRLGQPTHATITSRSREGAGQEVLLRLLRDDMVEHEQIVRVGTGAVPSAGCSLLPRQPGLYRVALQAADGSQALGPCLSLAVQPLPDEGTTRSADPAFLEEVAKLSGGAVWQPAEAGRWVDALRQRREMAALGQPHRTVWEPWWTTWKALALIAALLSVEWLIRIRSGLL